MADDDNRCRRCGSEQRNFFLPEIDEQQYDQARDAAGLIWKVASQRADGLVSVACLTAALLFKRAARQIAIPNEALPAMAAHYMQVVREIILERRRQAAEEKELN